MKNPPAPGPVRNVTFPEIPAAQLDNGLTVLCVEDHHLPRTSVIVSLPIGRAHDPDDLRGVTQVMVEMLKEGTESRTSREIAEDLDHLAIDFGCEVSMEQTILSVTQLHPNLEEGLELLSDLMLRPAFPDEELTKVKVRWHGHLVAQRSDPNFLASERLSLYWYEGHPYSKVSTPIEHLSNMTPERLRERHTDCFAPQSASILFAGPISLGESVRLSQRFFSNWTGEAGIDNGLPDVTTRRERSVHLVHRPDSTQTRLLIGLTACSRLDQAYTQFKLANQIFGGGASSRYFLNLREDKGYTYGAYSSLKAYRQAGLLAAGASVRTDVTSDAIKETFAEMEGMCSGPPEEQELSRCKAEINGAFVRGLESPSSIGSLELTRRILGLPYDFYRSYIPAIEAVTPDQVSALSKRLFVPDEAAIIAVGDAAQISNALEEFGPLAVYDQNGKSVG